MHQKAVGSIPGWGTYGKQPTDVSYIEVSLSLSLKSINIASDENLKNKRALIALRCSICSLEIPASTEQLG